jgi:hypothetical protein
VEKTKEIIGEENITEYIEPSAGAGVFLDYLDKPYLAFDIEPEDDRVQKQDWLNVELEYKKGRCIIGNPPYGKRNTLSVSFYKKSVSLSDYIAFILPISQLNNNQQMYEFDLVYSKDLDVKKYSDRDVHCCFNIYKRPTGELNEKSDYKLKEISVYEKRRTGNDNSPDKYDIAICGWGASIGKEINYKGQYANEKYIIIHNEKYKKQIIQILKNADWVKIFKMTATPVLSQWQIYKYIKEQIPEIK